MCQRPPWINQTVFFILIIILLIIIMIIIIISAGLAHSFVDRDKLVKDRVGAAERRVQLHRNRKAFLLEHSITRTHDCNSLGLPSTEVTCRVARDRGAGPDLSVRSDFAHEGNVAVVFFRIMKPEVDQERDLRQPVQSTVNTFLEESCSVDVVGTGEG